MRLGTYTRGVTILAVLAQASASVTPSPTASPSPGGIGGALGSVGGIVVIALLALGFLWLRGRALKR